MAGSRFQMNVMLGVNLDNFQTGLQKAAKRLEGFKKSANRIGATLSLSVTAPISALGFSILKTAGNFQAAMKGVQAITQSTGKQFKQLENLAKELGKTTKFSATEAAKGIEVLARNGVSATNILNGMAKATLQLAAATGKDMTISADVLTDAVNNFSEAGEDMRKTINQITGATVNSKFDLLEYQGALAQAAGVAGNVGVTFKDFNTVLALTSSAFKSGSDAGTSLKTFLINLNPKSKEAAREMKKLGISFFEANGEMKSMSEITRILQTSFGGLTEQQRSHAAQTIFGTDAMRTALILAAKGGQKFDELAQSIEKVSAQQQAEKRMEGFNGALQAMKSAFEALQIAIADSGLLEFATKFINVITVILRKLSTLSPTILKTVTIIAGLAAAIGPLVLTLGSIASILPILKAGFAVLSLIMSPIVLKVLAIAAAVAALVLIVKAIIDSWGVIVPFFKGIWNKIKLIFLKGALGGIQAVESLSSVIGIEFKNAKKSVTDSINSISKDLSTNKPPELSNVFIEMGHSIQSTFKNLRQGVTSELGKMFLSMENIKKKAAGFAAGFGGTGKRQKKIETTEAATGEASFAQATGLVGIQEMDAFKPPPGLNAMNEQVNNLSSNIMSLGEALNSISEQRAADPFFDVLSAQVQAYQDALLKAKRGTKEYAAIFAELQKSKAKKVMQDIGLGMIEMASSAVSSGESFKDAARGIIKALIAQGVAAVVANTLANAGAAGPFAVAIAGLAGVAAAALFDKIIPQFANGGQMMPGLATVGERGPELIATGGGRVMSSSDMARNMRSGSDVNVNISGEISGDDIAIIVERTLQKFDRVGL